MRAVRGKASPIDAGLCSQADVWIAARAEGPPLRNETTYTWQATQLPHFTAHLRWWDIRQCLQDLVSGNVKLGRFLSSLCYAGFLVCPIEGDDCGPAAALALRPVPGSLGRRPIPQEDRHLAAGLACSGFEHEPAAGELVRVKSYADIVATLDGANKNRGRFFDAELVPFCAREYRVRRQLTDFIDEKTGRMASLKTPAVILEDVWCQSRYSACRVFCPRSIFSWWREAWLEKISERSQGTP